MATFHTGTSVPSGGSLRRNLRRTGAAAQALTGSGLAVHPYPAGTGIARPLAPCGDRLALRGDPHLAVVAVGFPEPGCGLVARAARGVRDLHRPAPAAAAVARCAVPDVPLVEVPAARGLEEEHPDVPVAARRHRRGGRHLAVGRHRLAAAPRLPAVGGALRVDPLQP